MKVEIQDKDLRKAVSDMVKEELMSLTRSVVTKEVNKVAKRKTGLLVENNLKGILQGYIRNFLEKTNKWAPTREGRGVSQIVRLTKETIKETLESDYINAIIEEQLKSFDAIAYAKLCVEAEMAEKLKKTTLSFDVEK